MLRLAVVLVLSARVRTLSLVSTSDWVRCGRLGVLRSAASDSEQTLSSEQPSLSSEQPTVSSEQQGQPCSLLEVELSRPLGVTVQEATDGAVFVTASRGGALEAGVAVGDVVVAVSAVFGDDLWEVRNAGVERVRGLIRSRSGDTVRLRLERGYEYHLVVEEEVEEDFQGDIDSETMKAIFNVGSATTLINNRRTMTAKERRRLKFEQAAEDVDDGASDVLKAFFQDLEVMQLKESPPVNITARDLNDDKMKTTPYEVANEAPPPTANNNDGTGSVDNYKFGDFNN